MHGLNAQNEVCPNSSFLVRYSLNTTDFPLVSSDIEELVSTNPAFIVDSPNSYGFINVRAPNQANATTTLIYRVNNTCGVTELRTIIRTVASLGGRIIDCSGFGGKAELGIYPNPTQSDIIAIFKVECEECTSEELEELYPKIDESTVVTLNDAFGNIRLQYTGKQIPLDVNGNIRLSLSRLPVGNYILKVMTKEELFSAHIVKE